MTRHRIILIASLSAVAIAIGCGLNTQPIPPEVEGSNRDDDSGVPLVNPKVDASTGSGDSGDMPTPDRDAASDASTDAASDANLDASSDAPVDAAHDAGL